MTLSKKLAVVRCSFTFALTLVIAACSNDHVPPMGSAPTAEAGQKQQVTETPGVKPVELAAWKPDSAISSCHLDRLAAGSAVAQPGQPFHVLRTEVLRGDGWIGTEDEAAVPAEVGFRLFRAEEGKVWELKVPTGLNRSDVAEYKRKPALATSGFAFRADVSSLPAGHYNAYMTFEHEGKAFSCNGGDVLVLE